MGNSLVEQRVDSNEEKQRRQGIFIAAKPLAVDGENA